MVVAVTGLMIGVLARCDTMDNLKSAIGISDFGLSSRRHQVVAWLMVHFVLKASVNGSPTAGVIQCGKLI